MSDEPIGSLLGRLAESITLAFQPIDEELLQQAERSKGHISLKAVSDEYVRLLLEMHKPDASKLFGGSPHRDRDWA
jgi:hypothetical protein